MITVVTGASRGVGRGVAIALGRTGATVYVTGRSVSGAESPHGGSVTATAEAIAEAGGRGVPVAVDHADDDAVRDLFQRIRREHGRLDILVNNAAYLPETPDPKAPFWEKPLQAADLLTVGLRSHFVASYLAAPLLIAGGRGLIVNTGHYGAVSYHYGPTYGAQKAGADKLAADMAKELRPHDVAAVSLWMGSVATERGLAYRRDLSRAALDDLQLESPEYAGRVIAAFYASDQRMTLSGRALIAAELGARLGVTDVDGRQPPSHRDHLGAPPELHPSLLA